jgi:hypothetical protein
VIVSWLADEQVVQCLTSGDDSATAKAARADADQARLQLQEWHTLAGKGEIDAVGYANATRALLTRIEAAEQLMSATTIPPVLAGKLGDRAADTWLGLDTDIRRQLVRTVADIRVKRVPPGLWRRYVPAVNRIVWRWLIGPEPNEPIEFPDLVGTRTPVSAAATHCIYGHPFDEANTRYTKEGFRQCRTCGRERSAARRARERAASGSSISGAAVH